MNKRNILRVAKAIETAAKNKKGLRGVGFNMDEFCTTTSENTPDHVDSCGTVACIAGWAYLHRFPSVTASRFNRLEQTERIPEVAAKYFDLDEDAAASLFRPQHIDMWSWVDIKPLRAVAVLRHLAKTGEVDWSVKP